MGVLALGALGAMLPGVVVHGIDTQSLVVATAVVAVVLILGGLALTPLLLYVNAL